MYLEEGTNPPVVHLTPLSTCMTVVWPSSLDFGLRLVQFCVLELTCSNFLTCFLSLPGFACIKIVYILIGGFY